MNRTKMLLKSFAKPRKFEVLSELKINYKGEEHTFDNILLGEFGVLILTRFDKAGELYGNVSDQNFVLIDRKNKRIPCENLQNKAEKGETLLRKIVSDNKIYNVKIESAIIIENKNCKPMITVEKEVFDLKSLKKHLAQPKFDTDNKMDVNAVISALTQNKI